METSHLSSTLMILLVVFGVCALGWVGLVAYRGIIGHNEETDLIIDSAEAHFAKEQRDIGTRVGRLDKPILFLGIGSVVMALVSLAYWLWEGFNSAQ